MTDIIESARRAIARHDAEAPCGVRYLSSALECVGLLRFIVESASAAPPAALAVSGVEFPKCSKCGENSHPDDCQRPAKLEHEASADCWCEPELDSVDPDTGAKVWVHRETH